MIYAITKPTVNSDDNQWGQKLNDALDVLVGAANDNAAAAAAKLPLAGGALTGRLDAETATQAHVHLASVSPAVLDVAAALSFDVTINAATTFSFANADTLPANALVGVILRVVNGGSAALTWPGSVKWPSGSAPALTAAGTDLLVFTSDDKGVTWRGVLAAKDVR